MAKTTQELRQKRLENLKQMLAVELASDKPALRYIDDLSVTIEELTTTINLAPYRVIS